MEVILDNIHIHYEEIGKGQPVIIMHGWGQNTEMMYSIVNSLDHDKYHIYNIDLPGFGQSDEPNTEYTIDDYTNFLKEFIKVNKIDNPILIGHSFGCRISINYAAQGNPVKEMVLTGAAGIKDRRGLSYYARVYFYKFSKKFINFPFLKHYVLEAMENSGSEDYRNSSATMKAVLRNAVNFDQSDMLHKVKCPVLLIFGSNDESTPVWMGKKMESEMENAKLLVYPNGSHYAYLEYIDQFSKDMNEFLEGGAN